MSNGVWSSKTVLMCCDNLCCQHGLREMHAGRRRQCTSCSLLRPSRDWGSSSTPGKGKNCADALSHNEIFFHLQVPVTHVFSYAYT